VIQQESKAAWLELMVTDGDREGSISGSRLA
jgi:hypothetical protein